MHTIPTLGVEEEYQLVDLKTGHLRPDSKELMRHLHGKQREGIQHELHLTQIEMASPICHTLEEVRKCLSETRSSLIQAAEECGGALAAAGTNPFHLPEDGLVTPAKRYQVMSQRYQQIAKDLSIFGCHVHVELRDLELGLQAINHARRWLPVLQALTANSPFWDGQDTGYDSFRREMWAQWPMAGPPPEFRDLADYEECVDSLVRSGAIEDRTHIYWDIRQPHKVPTIEFRVADVMSRVEETVGYAGLVRAIVMQTSRDVLQGRPTPPMRQTVLAFSMWHAARYGLNQNLLDVVGCEQKPASECVQDLLTYVAQPLEETGDDSLVRSWIKNVLEDGNGATRQRQVAGGKQDAELACVVQFVAEETRQGTERHQLS